MNIFKRLFFKKTLKNKNPDDYTKCESSTDWQSDNMHCGKCLKSTSHSEYISDICNGCGSFNTQVSFGRSYRKIYVDGVWKYQIRYKNGRKEIRNEWY